MYIIYEQRQKTNLVVTSIYLIVFFLLFFIIFWPEILKIDPLPKITKIILFFVLLIDLAIFKSFYELKFRVTSEGLEFGYGILKNKVTKNNIESIFLDNSRSIFFGYGIRFSKDKTIGFIAKHGDGLKIVYKDQRKFFVTMDNPQEALNIIKENNYVSR
jgi:hypothetical protein